MGGRVKQRSSQRDMCPRDGGRERLKERGTEEREEKAGLRRELSAPKHFLNTKFHILNCTDRFLITHLYLEVLCKVWNQVLKGQEIIA